MVGIQMVMDNCQDSLNIAERGVEANLAEFRNIFVPIDAAKKLCEYLENLSKWIINLYIMINGLLYSIRRGVAQNHSRSKTMVTVSRRHFSSEFKRFFGYEQELEQTKVKNDWHLEFVVNKMNNTAVVFTSLCKV